MPMPIPLFYFEMLCRIWPEDIVRLFYTPMRMVRVSEQKR